MLDLDKEILIGLGKDIQELNKSMLVISVKVASIDTRVEERNTSADVWRASLCKKFDAINQLNEKIFGQIDKITINCITNIPKYIEMERHIKDEKDNKTLFKDKKFRFLLVISGAMFTFMFGFMSWLLQIRITDSNNELKRMIQVREKHERIVDQNTRVTETKNRDD